MSLRGRWQRLPLILIFNSLSFYYAAVTSFELITMIEAPTDQVFDLSRSVEIHAASMAKSREQAVGGVTEGMLELGEEVTWRARHFGMTFHMRTQIIDADRPNRFIDEQVKGPFKTWWHLHEFESSPTGTRMVDRIEYELPFGVFGWIADKLILKRHMTGLMEERNQYIKKVAESQR